MKYTRDQIEEAANVLQPTKTFASKIIRQLLAENDALREDAERLDWMGSVDDGFYNIDRISADCSIGFWCGLNAKPKHANLREAIDAARKKG